MTATAATESFTVYTSVPVRDLPYPHGLGKLDYPELEYNMKRLLGSRQDHQVANADAFWRPEYQHLIEKYLKPHFDRDGNILEISRQAVEFAQQNPLLGERIYGEPDARMRYWDGLPGSIDEQPRLVRAWVNWPPRITIYADGVRSYDDGRHRTAYLRSSIQQQNPDFGVLVRLDHVTHSS